MTAGSIGNLRRFCVFRKAQALQQARKLAGIEVENRLLTATGDAGRCRLLGHVWTAPWQELSDVAAALVGCGHVSGLLMRQVWPLALMLCADRVPIEMAHLEVR